MAWPHLDKRKTSSDLNSSIHSEAVEAAIVKGTTRVTSTVKTVWSAFNGQAPVVQKVDNAIHRINHYSLDIAIGFAITYPVDSDLSGG